MRMRKRAPLLLLLATVVALTGCRFAERSRRVASDAFASFVLESLLRMQTPLTQGTVQRSSSAPAPQIPAAAPAGTPDREPQIAVCPFSAKPKIGAEVLPIKSVLLAANELAAAPSCKRLHDIRVIRYDVAKMRLEVRFAAAELAGMPELPRRHIVVVTETL